MEIQGYENYLIYPDGRVYSKKNNIFLKPKIDNGYHRIKLCKGKHKFYFIHRLVAKYYIPNTENKSFVDHIDRNTLNNDISNLRWVTYSENNLNKGTQKNNTSGHKNISYNKSRLLWKYDKRVNQSKCIRFFKTKTEALCFKFIVLLVLQAKIPVTVLSFK